MGLGVAIAAILGALLLLLDLADHLLEDFLHEWLVMGVVDELGEVLHEGEAVALGEEQVDLLALQVCLLLAQLVEFHLHALLAPAVPLED